MAVYTIGVMMWTESAVFTDALEACLYGPHDPARRRERARMDTRRAGGRSRGFWQGSSKPPNSSYVHISDLAVVGIRIFLDHPKRLRARDPGAGLAERRLHVQDPRR